MVKARSSQFENHIRPAGPLLYHTTLALWLFLDNDVFDLGGVARLSRHAPLHVDRARRALVVLHVAVARVQGGGRRLLGRLRDGLAQRRAVRERAVRLVVREVPVARCRRDGLAVLYQLHDLVCFPAEVSARPEWVVPTTFRAETQNGLVSVFSLAKFKK